MYIYQSYLCTSTSVQVKQCSTLSSTLLKFPETEQHTGVPQFTTQFTTQFPRFT